MQKSSLNPAALWGGLGILLITTWRIVGHAFSSADLFVDEAQYWLWGQSIEWGYYSKPPLIGWVIRLFTEIGTDSAFWVRLPAPIFHGATAALIMAASWRVVPAWAAALSGLAYLTMPGIAVGSFLISTDTILLPFFAAALWIWFSLTERPSPWGAIGLGAILGLGMLAKYAAFYFLIGAVFAQIASPYRLRLRDIALALAAFAIVISPNIWWNLQNGLSTLDHTVDNVDWIRDPGRRRGLNWGSLGAFIGSQFLFFGPLLMAAYLWFLPRAWRQSRSRALMLFSLPILLLVCGQALASRAYGNWAAPAYVAAVMMVLPMLWDTGKRRLGKWILAASFTVNLIFTITIPLAGIFATAWHVPGKEQLLMSRYVGRAAISTQILDQAGQANLTTITSPDRDILADLMLRAPKNVQIYSPPPNGQAKNHYALKHPLPQSVTGPILLADWEGAQPICDGPVLVRLPAGPGAYRGRTLILRQITPDCFGN
jgi:4-amino-4-deoxy-L-arabinose transferase-like glycosyltransferase